MQKKAIQEVSRQAFREGRTMLKTYKQLLVKSKEDPYNDYDSVAEGFALACQQTMKKLDEIHPEGIGLFFQELEAVVELAKQQGHTP